MQYQDLLIILNLIVIESLLSVDNATALAAMVQHLPAKQRIKALRYGLFGAYFFRGLCLFLAVWLVKIIWLKIVGGLYLVYLLIKHFKEVSEEGLSVTTKYKSFWATIVSVEILDLSLSIDNIFAAVALSDKFWVIMVGVGIGILAMRFVAGWFVKLIEHYPMLTHSAYLVIGLLGLKLILSGVLDYLPNELPTIKAGLDSHWFDLWFSLSMVVIFLFPFVYKKKEEKTIVRKLY